MMRHSASEININANAEQYQSINMKMYNPAWKFKKYNLFHAKEFASRKNSTHPCHNRNAENEQKYAHSSSQIDFPSSELIRKFIDECTDQCFKHSKLNTKWNLLDSVNFKLLLMIISVIRLRINFKPIQLPFFCSARLLS